MALTRAQDELILTIPLGMTKTTNPFAKAADLAHIQLPGNFRRLSLIHI